MRPSALSQNARWPEQLTFFHPADLALLPSMDHLSSSNSDAYGVATASPEAENRCTRWVWILARATLTCILLLATTRCDLASEPDASTLVVEAFLEAGEPLPPVQLRQTRDLRDPLPPDDSLGDAATGADLRVAVADDTVTYAPGDAPGTYVPTRAVTVSPGASFFLEARWEGERGVASGTVPPRISIRSACLSVPQSPVEAILVDSLRRDSLDIPAEQGFIFPVDVTLNWDPEAQVETAWVRAGLQPSADFSSGVVELFLQPTEVSRESAFVAESSPERDRQWTGVYAVSAPDSTPPIVAHRITVSLTRGDSAFAAFASSRTDPERREPVSNVDGAIGVATAVSLDTLGFDVPEGASGEICSSEGS